MNNASQPVQVCPYLGLTDDPDTSLGFPSNRNCCYHSKPAVPPRYYHQEEFCLSVKHTQCPLYVSPRPEPMPRNLQIPLKTSRREVPKDLPKNLIIAIAALGVVLIIAWALFNFGLLPTNVKTESAPVNIVVMSTASPTVERLPTETASALPFQADVPTLTSSPVKDPVITNTLTPIPVLTSTFAPTSIPSDHALEMLIGTDYKFVIHRVLNSESMDAMAITYSTSADAIKTMNYFQTNPGWSGTLVVVPVGFTDVANIPSFDIVQLKSIDRGISIDSLAERLRVSAADLKYYNGWNDEGDRPLVGDYFLVPRPRPSE